VNKNIIEIENLKTYFESSSKLFNRNKIITKAVDGISFDLEFGKSLGIVGQSGCGKTTTARTITMLEEKTSGEIRYFNESTNEMTSIDGLGEEEIKNFRRNVQMIFQDPYEAMNPRWMIKDTILEPLSIHNIGTEEDRDIAVYEMLKTVGLTPPENYLNRYPHELSGGQRQRVAIARALVMKPKFIICDEPTSMLDVSIRISIMDLMINLAKDLGVSYLYITHDLAVARYMCERIAVMYNGKIVEIAETEELLKNPIHPYTKRLISSIPVPDPKYVRKVYEVNQNDLDHIYGLNENDSLFDIGNNHYVATHKVEGLI
tara:strand:- start:1709 stop:2659 length:951 start_codon:yes stop_codon:yes gene_type:complete